MHCGLFVETTNLLKVLRNTFVIIVEEGSFEFKKYTLMVTYRFVALLYFTVDGLMMRSDTPA